MTDPATPPKRSLRKIGRALVIAGFALFIPDVIVGYGVYRLTNEFVPSAIVTFFLFFFNFMLIGFGFAAINSDLSGSEPES